MIGQTVSHYRIASQIGAGGMGIVYAGEDVRLGRPVAVKFVPEDLAKDDLALERLRSEARTASGLNHANICTIYDVGEHDGRPFIVMELLTGQSLRDRLAAGPIKTHQVVDLGIHIADALDSAHQRGVIHRDIKPANLFLVDRGPVKILDFGLAKFMREPRISTATGSTTDLTADGVTLGTVAYMSPEQVTGETLDGRTDLFSLGVVLYECLTGHQPFTGKTSAVIFSAILNRAPVAPVVFNPDLPPRLQEVVQNCLEKDRELRYPDAAGLRADLKRVKRDIESGHSGVVRTVSGFSSAGHTSSGGRRGTPAVDDGEGEGVDTLRRESKPAASTGRSPRRVTLAAAVVAGILAVAAAMTAMYLRSSRNPAPSQPATPVASDTLVRSRLDLATTRLEARDYRAALASAEEVLRAVPDQQEAIRVRDTARATLARFDDALARANDRLAAGDVDGAAGALNIARSIDASAPAVVDLSARLVSELRTQAEAARRESQRSRTPTAAPPQRPSSAEPPRTAASAQPPAQRTPVEPTAPPPAMPPPAPPAPAPPTPATAAPTTPQSSPPAPAPAPAPAAAAPAPAAPPPTVPLPAAQPAPAAAEMPRESPAQPARTTESDDAAIRRTVATYARAIETKDLALFRTVKPNLSAAEQRRLEEGFRAVETQQVTVTILSIEHRGQEASVRLRRRDTIQAAGRPQTTESQQTMILTRSGSGWIIREIGR